VSFDDQVREAVEEEKVYAFTPRGIGSNWIPCFICGHKPLSSGGLQADMAAFVHSGDVMAIDMGADKEPIRSHPIEEWCRILGLTCQMDTRRADEARFQIKFGACGEHEPNLRLLEYTVALRAEHLRQFPKKDVPTNHLRIEDLIACIPGRKRA